MMMSASRTVSSTVSSTLTRFPSCSDMRGREALPGLGALAGDADLLEVEEPVEHRDVVPGGAAGADVAQDARPLGREVLRADRGHAPVRIQVMSVPSTMANGAPVSDRYSVISASSDGRPNR